MNSLMPATEDDDASDTQLFHESVVTFLRCASGVAAYWRTIVHTCCMLYPI